MFLPRDWQAIHCQRCWVCSPGSELCIRTWCKHVDWRSICLHHPYMSSQVFLDLEGPNISRNTWRFNFQSFASFMCQLSQYAFIFSTPGRCSTWIRMFLLIHQSHTWDAKSDKMTEWVPPILLRKVLAVILSTRSSTEIDYCLAGTKRLQSQKGYLQL